MKDFKKIRLLMALVVVAYVLSIREGYLASKRKAIAIKQYANETVYPAVSLFRIGLFWLKISFYPNSSRMGVV